MRIWSLLGGGLVVAALFLSSPASSQELFVGNRPFKGAVAGSGANQRVELAELAKALHLSLKEQAGGWIVMGAGEAGPAPVAGAVMVGGTAVPVDLSSGQPMVSLAQFCQAAGAKIVTNRELGTVDVHLADAGAQAAGDWGSPETSSMAAKSQDASTAVKPQDAATVVTKDGVTVTPPAGWDVWTDAEGKIDMRTRQENPATFLSIRWRPLEQYHCKNLAEVGQDFRNQIAQKPTTENCTLAGLPALRLSVLAEPTPLVHVFAVKGKQVYDVSLMCPFSRKAEMLSVLDAFLSSVKIK